MIGIDKIGFATSQYVLDMKKLAEARGQKPEKFTTGLMLDALSIAPVNEDIITLAASACLDILTEEDKQKIDMILFATESSIDQSKAAAVYIHELLGIQPFARSLEIKEACYAATAGLDYARLYVEKHPERRVLVIASDIAKYGIATAGEPTQGAGAIAMLISQNPRLLALNHDNVTQTRDIMDFWRPNYTETPLVNGIYSTKQYLDSLQTTWQEYSKRHNLDMASFAAFCLHLPYPKLALKGLQKILPKTLDDKVKAKLLANFEASITYSKQVGNIYTGSLYLGLLSLLENSDHLKAGDRIGFFSYGSGAVSEVFSGHLVEGFDHYLNTSRLQKLHQRQAINVADYEKLFYEPISLDETGSTTFHPYKTGAFALQAITEHQRIYQIK